MLSFSCWVAMSAAKCFLFFWLYICLNEFLLCFCFSRALISSAKSFWRVLLFWTELCVVPASMLSFSRRAALSAAKYLLFSDFKSVSRSYFYFLDRPNFSIILSAGWYLLFELGPDFVCQIFLKGPAVWTELCVVPASMLSFSHRAALSAAKYLLMSVFKSVSRSYFWCQNLSDLLLIFLHTEFNSRLYTV